MTGSPPETTLLPIVCTSGEAETALASGRLNLLLAGPQTDPGLLALCGKMKVPLVSSVDNPGAAAILKQARAAFDRRIPVSFTPDATLIGEGKVSLGAAEVEAALQGGHSAKIALLGGADTLLQSLGHLPVELAKALRGENHAVASWGDAALWMVKQDLPVGILEANEGPLTAVRVLAAKGKLSALKGICFTGLKELPGVHLRPGACRARPEGLGRRTSTPLGKRKGPHDASRKSGSRGRHSDAF